MLQVNRRQWCALSICEALWTCRTLAAAGGEPAGSGTTLGTSAFNIAAFTQDGKQLLTAASYGKIGQLWDVASGRQLRRFQGHSEEVRIAAFSPDEEWVVTGAGRKSDMGSVSTDNSVRVWDAATGVELHRLIGHESFVFSLMFSPSGQQVLSTARDSTARMWDVERGVELFRISGMGYMQPALFDPRGRFIVAVERTNRPFRARIWTAERGQEVTRIELHHAINMARFSPSGRQFVTGCADGTTRVWDSESGRELQSFEGHEGSVESADFVNNGTSVLTGSRDGTARVWNVSSGKQLNLFRHRGEVISAVLNSATRRLLVQWTERIRGESRVVVSLWDAEARTEILKHPLPNIYGRQLASLTPDGKWLLTTSKATTLWNAITGEIVRHYE
jgi:WD40 repeat protein